MNDKLYQNINFKLFDINNISSDDINNQKFIKFIIDSFKNNNIKALNIINTSKFILRILNETENKYELSNSYLTSNSRYVLRNGKSNLDTIIINLLNYYHKYYIIKKNNKFGDYFYYNINKFVIEYYFLIGKNKSIINKLIKNNFWSLLNLIHSITPIEDNDIYIKNLNLEQIDELNKLDIYFENKLSYFFKYNSSDIIISKLHNYSLCNIINNLSDIYDTNIFDYLINNNIISLKRKDIHKYHINCNIFLLNYLIDNYNIIPKNKDIIAIFKKKKEKKTKYNYNINIIRRNKVSILNDKTNINPNTSKSDFIFEIKGYFNRCIDKKIIITINKQILKVLINTDNYDILIKLLLNCNISKTINAYYKKCIFTYLVKNDNIDIFTKLIDNNIININILHDDIYYISSSIENNAINISTYMVNNLHVKFINYNAHNIWGWSLQSKTDEQIINSLRLMKKLNLPIIDSLMNTFLYHMKPLKFINILINEFNMKITKKHLKNIKYYPKKQFCVLSSHIKYNKKRLINSLLTNKTKKWNGILVWSRPNNVKLVLYLISTLPNKVNISRKYALMSLCNDYHYIFNILCKRYNIIFKDKEIKQLLKIKKIKSSGIKIIFTLIKNNPNILGLIKKYFSKIQIQNLLLTNINNSYNSKLTINLFKKLDIDIDLNIINSFINCDAEYYINTIFNKTFIIELIKSSDKYIKNDITFIKSIINLFIDNECSELLLKLDINVIKKIINTEFLYDITLTKCAIGQDIKSILNLAIELHKKYNILTPYYYKIIITGYKASLQNDDIWYRTNLNNRYMDSLFNILNKITNEDYNEFIKLGFFEENFIKHTINIIDYYPKEYEIPDMMDYYTNMANKELDNICDELDIEIKHDIIDTDFNTNLLYK